MTFSLAQLTEKALVGVRGGARFAEALAANDWATDATVKARRATCGDCPTRTVLLGSDWCGDPMVETSTSCGCLLAGKTAIGSERCPQGKW